MSHRLRKLSKPAIFMLLSLLSGMTAVNVLSSSPPPPQSEEAASRTVASATAQSAGPPLVESDERALREIMEIRRRQDDLFAGTLFEEFVTEAADDQFLQALRSAAESAPAPSFGGQEASNACEASYRRQLQQEQGGGADNLELVEALRLSSRSLDAQAAELEDSREYNEADRLRRLADTLRREARKWLRSNALVDRRLEPAQSR